MKLVFKTLIGVIFFLFSTIFVLANPNDYWIAIKKDDWKKATVLAAEIDAKLGHGQVYVAYTDARFALLQNDCKKASAISSAIVKFQSDFLPPYDILAACLVKNGQRQKASELLINVSNGLNEGPFKDLYYRRGIAIAKVLKPYINFGVTISPSNNITRRTEAKTLGNSFIINPESRSQRGIGIGAHAKLTQPLFNSKRMLTEASLIVSGSYDTVSDTTYPSLGFELNNTWLLSPKTSFSLAPSVSVIWKDGTQFYNKYGVQTRIGHQFQNNIYGLFILNTSRFDFTHDDDRDSWRVEGSAIVVKRFNINNKVTAKIEGKWNKASIEYYNERDISSSIDWQHRFHSGFIGSAKISAGLRDFDRAAPLTNDARFDIFGSVGIGVSHEKIQWHNIRPEITYSFQKQVSNDLFNDFNAHDFGIVLRGNF